MKKIIVTEETQFLDLMKIFNIEIYYLDNKKYFEKRAIKDKAVKLYGINNGIGVYYYFNNKGEFTGYSGDQLNSYISRKN